MKVTVIGGGAAGMAVAILAAPYHDVLLLEGEDRVGKKLLSTGNGRCNLTNVKVEPSRYHGSSEEKISSVLRRKGRDETIEFFRSMGLETVAEASNKIYPVTLQASSVLNLFLQELDHRKVNVITGEKVRKIRPEGEGFRIFTDGEEYFTHVTVIATGGRSMERTGSDGSGYGLARSLGHSVTKVFPAIVPLKGDSPYLRHLKGTKAETSVKLLIDGESAQGEEGELLFTEYGVSGPPILDLSRRAIEALQEGRKPELVFSVINYLTEERKEIIEELYYRKYDRSLEEFLTGVVHKKFHHPIIKELNVERRTPLFELEGPKKEKLFQLLYSFHLPITGHLGFGRAQVTCGGVPLDEVDENMESNICPGLYFAGEVLDVDGDCGGFNLQWAWSTAMIIGDRLRKLKG